MFPRKRRQAEALAETGKRAEEASAALAEMQKALDLSSAVFRVKYKCTACGIGVALPGGVCGSCRNAIAAGCRSRLDPGPRFETVHQEELLQGTKYATLWMDKDGKPEFRGSGYTHKAPYGTEAYAVCGLDRDHEVPDPACTCGFWTATRKESRLSTWAASDVALEVEFGGKVIDCGKDPLPAPPWGYRAQWQRVLSVTLRDACYSCGRPGPQYLVSCGVVTRQLVVSCGACLAYLGGTPVEKPVTWLREGLQTEIRPGTVTDDAPPVRAGSGTDWSLPVSRGIVPTLYMPPYTGLSYGSPYGGLRTRKTWTAVVPAGSANYAPTPYPAHAVNVQWKYTLDEPADSSVTITCSWEE